MRVLHVTDTYLPRRGGIELHVHDLAQAQQRAGHEVDILTLTRAHDGAAAHSIGTLLRPAATAGLFEKVRFVQANRLLGSRAEYDVVHAHCSTMSPLVFATLGAARVPTAVTAHSLWRRYTALYRAGDVAFGWSRWPVAWSAVSDVAAAAIRRSAMRPLTVDVVPNGIDLSAWPLARRDPEPGRLRTISVMRLSPRKRPLALLRMLRAADAAMPAGTKFSAVIVGDGPNAPAMRRYIRRHGMERFVTLAGHLPRPEIARRLAQADIFVAPATLESFGIAALEACAAGVPVLGRAATGLSDFVSDGSGGLLVGSDAAMVEALVDLSIGRRCVQPADRHTIEAMSWPSVVARTRALYARAGLACDASETSTTKRWAS